MVQAISGKDDALTVELPMLRQPKLSRLGRVNPINPVRHSNGNRLSHGDGIAHLGSKQGMRIVADNEHQNVNEATCATFKDLM